MSARQPSDLLLAAQHQVDDTVDEAAAGALDFMHLITIDGNRLIVNSRAVAAAFRKAHKNVMRNIDATRASKNPIIAAHGRLNFEPSSYLNKWKSPFWLALTTSHAFLGSIFNKILNRITFYSIKNSWLFRVNTAQQCCCLLLHFIGNHWKQFLLDLLRNQLCKHALSVLRPWYAARLDGMHHPITVQSFLF